MRACRPACPRNRASQLLDPNRLGQPGVFGYAAARPVVLVNGSPGPDNDIAPGAIIIDVDAWLVVPGMDHGSTPAAARPVGRIAIHVARGSRASVQHKGLDTRVQPGRLGGGQGHAMQERESGNLIVLRPVTMVFLILTALWAAQVFRTGVNSRRPFPGGCSSSTMSATNLRQVQAALADLRLVDKGSRSRRGSRPPDRL